MINNKIYKMSFSKVYPLLIAKAEKKGRTRDEIDEITCWLTGYSKEQVADFLVNDVAYGEFYLSIKKTTFTLNKMSRFYKFLA